MGILEGKAAVVTGGGRGVGRGECLHLAAQGAGVVVNDVDGEEARKVVTEIRAALSTAARWAAVRTGFARSVIPMLTRRRPLPARGVGSRAPASASTGRC